MSRNNNSSSSSNNDAFRDVPSYGAVAVDEQTSPLFCVADAVNSNCDDANAGGSEPIYQDVAFAVLFCLHLAVMLYLGIFVAPDGYTTLHEMNWTRVEDEMRSETDDVTDEDWEKMERVAQEVSDYLRVYPFRIALYLVVPSLLFGFLLAFLVTMAILRPFPKTMVHASLIGSVLCTTIIMLSTAIATNALPMYCIAGVAIAGMLYYVKLAWRMVPFAAVNLKVALQGIGTNWGLYFVAFVFSQLGFLWNLFWLYAVVGISAKQNTKCLAEHPEVNVEDCPCGPPPVVFLMFLLSLYWTTTVLMNSIQVTVAG
jgi:Plasma-membrane choline transporter